MKKLLVVALAAFLVTGLAFAGGNKSGKECCSKKGAKKECSKEKSACCKEKKAGCCKGEKKAEETPTDAPAK